MDDRKLHRLHKKQRNRPPQVRLPSEPKYRHCQNGGDICLAGWRSGICCPNDSCDIDDDVRNGTEHPQRSLL